MNKKRADIEWIGGLISMPGYVTGEGEPYRPEALLWMGPGGLILGTTVGKPGEVIDAACESLQAAIARPMAGRPHAPARVRVASPELASALRAAAFGFDVVCAATPELDAVLAAMREHLADNADGERSYLSPETDPDAIAALFRAAAALFRTQPWKIVPGDQSIISVTIEQLGLKDAAMSVIGQMGEHFGFVVFSSFDDFDAYLDASDAIERGAKAAIPPHFSLNFERRAELDAGLRKEITDHRWEIASDAAYPWMFAVDEDLVARPPTAREVTAAEAISLALVKTLADKDALIAAWSGGAVVTRSLSVRTHAGEFEVTLRAPHQATPTANQPPYDVIADLFELAADGAAIDPEAREPLEEELMRRFAASREAASLSDVGSWHVIMDFAANYFGATIATLAPAQLRQIVFELIPQKVVIEASAARQIIDEGRAFYAFLKREFALAQADACRRVLGGDAVKKLEAALSNTGNFGIAKSLLMDGRKAGFDMDTKEGIDAWMRIMQSRPLPDSIRLPSPDPQPRPRPAKDAARTSKRKAARKAPKKNR